MENCRLRMGSLRRGSIDACQPTEANGWIGGMNDFLAALPHGPEFRFVDALDALDPGKSAVARYRVRGDEAFLAGHFPGIR